MSVRILVVDDQPMMRAAFRLILDGDGRDVVGEAGDGAGAVAEAERLRPDVILMDIRMPGRDGLSATAEIAARTGLGRVLVLTTFDDDEALHGALRAGAAGFLLKNSTPEELIRAVDLVAAGESVLDPAVTARVMSRAAGRPRRPEGGYERLTEREKDVLALVVRGLTNGEIAESLDMGEATAKTHVSHVLAKLGVRDRVQAVIHAYEHGFVDDGR